MYAFFRAHGKASRTNPKPGDLVIWGGGSHVGIYIGHGYAISTLHDRRPRSTGVHAVTARFTTYLHTGMWKTLVARPAPKVTVQPKPTPTSTPTPYPDPGATAAPSS